MYENAPFQFHSPQAYLDITIAFLEKLKQEIVIQRLFGEAPPRTLIAPNWGLRNNILLQMLDEEMEKRDSWQGKFYKD